MSDKTTHNKTTHNKTSNETTPEFKQRVLALVARIPEEKNHLRAIGLAFRQPQRGKTSWICDEWLNDWQRFALAAGH